MHVTKTTILFNYFIWIQKLLQLAVTYQFIEMSKVTKLQARNVGRYICIGSGCGVRIIIIIGWWWLRRWAVTTMTRFTTVTRTMCSSSRRNGGKRQTMRQRTTTTTKSGAREMSEKSSSRSGWRRERRYLITTTLASINKRQCSGISRKRTGSGWKAREVILIQEKWCG